MQMLVAVAVGAGVALGGAGVFSLGERVAVVVDVVPPGVDVRGAVAVGPMGVAVGGRVGVAVPPEPTEVGVGDGATVGVRVAPGVLLAVVVVVGEPPGPPDVAVAVGVPMAVTVAVGVLVRPPGV